MKLLFLSMAFSGLLFTSSQAIYNGHDAKDGQFPYMTLLTYGGFKLNFKECSAAIIHPRWLVTSAHCKIKHPEPLITLGTVGDFGTGKIYEIHQFYAHENYTLVPEEQNDGLEIVYNDIGLIHLASDVEFSDKVNKVKLETDENKNYENKVATVCGWGQETYDGLSSDHLRYIKVPVLTMDTCRKVWTYADKHVCTSNKEKGLCYADSGSPLVVDGVLIGIASTTDTYCQSLKPDMYCKVASFIPWIKNKMYEHGDVLE